MPVQQQQQGWGATDGKTAYGLGASPVHVPVNLIIGDTGVDLSSAMAAIWSPRAGYRYFLHGGRLSIVCTVSCTGSGVGVLFLADDGKQERSLVSLAVVSLSTVHSTVISDPVAFTIPSGVFGSDTGVSLKIGTTASLGNGKLRVTGLLWGDEVPR